MLQTGGGDNIDSTHWPSYAFNPTYELIHDKHEEIKKELMEEKQAVEGEQSMAGSEER